MPIRASLLPLALLLPAAGLFAADPGRPAASFTVSALAAVPGKTLPPGSYSIHVLDRLSDRYILQVDGAEERSHTLFLGIPSTTLSAGKSGEIDWKAQAEGATYLRGWKFAGLPALEFVYPKNDAVAVAKANGATVPAVDPESDNITSVKLSEDEQKIVTLWLLSPTPVGPGAPAGIAAKKLSQVAAVHRPSSLPHTAGDLPLAALLGTLSLCGAFAFRASATRARR